MTPLTTVIASLFDAHRDERYLEDLGVGEHMLQTAHFAAQDGCDRALVVACLLHDVGYFLGDFAEDVANTGRDTRHERIGALYLSRHFGPEVTAPIALHVAAKRYLCAIDPGYDDQLSAASKQTLEIQGGPFDAAGVRAFEATTGFEAACALRRFDDRGKEPGLEVPRLEHYFDDLEALRIDR